MSKADLLRGLFPPFAWDEIIEIPVAENTDLAPGVGDKSCKCNREDAPNLLPVSGISAKSFLASKLISGVVAKAGEGISSGCFFSSWGIKSDPVWISPGVCALSAS